MGQGTQYPSGVIDGVATSEGGSALLIAGSTVLTLGLDSIAGIGVSAESFTELKAVVGQGASKNQVTITSKGGSSFRVRYVAVGPRTTSY